MTNLNKTAELSGVGLNDGLGAEAKMKHINWNQMSELGLIERINREVLHPLGLAVSRDVETGHSTKILVADDGVWEYAPEMKTTVLPDSKVKELLNKMAST
jgi:hypothetical protein